MELNLLGLEYVLKGTLEESINNSEFYCDGNKTADGDSEKFVFEKVNGADKQIIVFRQQGEEVTCTYLDNNYLLIDKWDTGIELEKDGEKLVISQLG